MTRPPVKTRFAPSPTGLLHIGNVRTALFNRLLSGKQGGVFLLRIEDTDATRGEEKYEQALQQDLTWLGLDWQEGPQQDRGNGPYWQSERGAVYDTYYEQLRQGGQAYPCFCTEHELKLSRKAQMAAGQPPRYTGRCARLSEDEVASRFAEGLPATLRFRVDDEAVIEFDDKVRGSQRFVGKDIGDFIIRRSDGTPAFFFCNAVDDALMGVSLVIRGEDHLTNTPRQMLLLKALGLTAPDYAHIALVTGSDGAPLSKRNGSQTVHELREQGFLPGAVLNYLARLGHTYESNDYLTGSELANALELGHMHKAPARYDPDHLVHWQKEAVQQMGDDALWQWLQGDARIGSKVPEDQAASFVHTIRDNIVMPDDAAQWAHYLYSEDGYHSHEAHEVIRDAGSVFFETALSQLEADAVEFGPYAKAVGKALGVKGKSLFMPLRAALTGVTHGPEMARVWQLLGPVRTRQRLEQARDIATGQ